MIFSASSHLAVAMGRKTGKAGGGAGEFAVTASPLAAIMSSTAPQSLSYSSPLRRRRVRVWLIACAAAVIVIGAYDRDPKLYAWAKDLYTQWRFLRYTAPADRVIVETDIDAAKRLLSQPGYVSLPRTWHVDAFYPGSTPEMSLGSEGVLFLHERHTPKGERRLVTCSIVLAPMTYLHTAIYRPTWNGLQRIRGDMVLHSFQGRVARILAGQPDAADPTHFTILYQADGQQRVLDAWLQDDDWVEFQVRGAAPSAQGFFALWPNY